MSERPAYRAMAKVFSIVLLLVSLFALWGWRFSHGYVDQQLRQENITMPSLDSIKSLPQEAQDALKPWAGDGKDQKPAKMLDGDQAQAYANHYIWEHMQTACKSIKASNGVEMKVDDCTYAGIGDYTTKKKAELKGKGMNDADIAKSPEVTALNAARDSNFKGDALRSMLLTAYAFWTIGNIAKWAFIGCLLGAILLGLLGWFLLKDKVAHKEPTPVVTHGTDRVVTDKVVTTNTKPVDVDVDDHAVKTTGAVNDTVVDRTVTKP